MNKPIIIYADVCCLNRPLDDTRQLRIRLEAETMLSILQKCQKGEWILLNSDAIEFEISRHPDSWKKEKLRYILSVTTRILSSSEAIESRASTLMGVGFKFLEEGEAKIYTIRYYPYPFLQ